MVTGEIEEVRKYTGRRSYPPKDPQEEFMQQQSRHISSEHFFGSSISIFNGHSSQSQPEKYDNQTSFGMCAGNVSDQSFKFDGQPSFGMCAGYDMDMSRYFSYENIDSGPLVYRNESPLTFSSASDLMNSYSGGESELRWDGFGMRPN